MKANILRKLLREYINFDNAYKALTKKQKIAEIFGALENIGQWQDKMTSAETLQEPAEYYLYYVHNDCKVADEWNWEEGNIDFILKILGIETTKDF